MFKSDYVEFEYDHYGQDVSSTYDNVRLPKVVKKGKRKILFVLDAMPSEDLRSGKLLSGGTGKLLESMLTVTPQYHGADVSIKDFQWLAISYNAYRTAGQLEQFKLQAEQDFTDRLNFIILAYKPDIVVTFGRRPTVALNMNYLQQFRGKKGVQYHHFYGVPIDTTLAVDGKEHSFQHVSTLSLNTLANPAGGKGGASYLIGYVMRNLLTVLNHGELMYRMPKMKFKTTYVDTIDKFKDMIKDIRGAKDLAVDTETTSLNRRVNKTLIIQFATSDKHAYVVPIAHKDSTWRAKELQYIIKTIRDLIEHKNKTKYLLFANAKFDIIRLRSDFGVRHLKADIWDIFAGEFAHDENAKELTNLGAHYYSLLNICMQYGNTDYYEAEFGKEQRTTITHVDMSPALIQYCAMDVISLHMIKRLQLRRAEDTGYAKYESLVGQQISDKLHMFAAMEYHGSTTDIDYLFYLQSAESPLNQHRDAVIHALNNTKGALKTNKLLTKQSNAPTTGLFGRTNLNMFNVRKRKHLELLMFNVLKLAPVSVGKSGAGQIDKKFQAKYGDVEEVALYNELQKVNKLSSSYVKAFIKQWGVDDDMRFDRTIRPDFGFITVVTGRSSARKPSLHQIPSRNNVTKLILKLFPGRADLGKYIKRLFVAPEGRIILKIDFAAHEVRCFHLDSYVHTEAGMMQFRHFLYMPKETRPRVYSYNHATGEVELKAVGTQSIHVPENDMYELHYNGGMIPLTGNHPLWSNTRKAYIRADDMKVGEDVLLEDVTDNGIAVREVKLNAILNIARPALVCDIGVEDNHNLFVASQPDQSPVLVHNCWSIISGDKDVAAQFQHGLDMRNHYKLFPHDKLQAKIKTEGDPHRINAAYFFTMDINKVDKAKRDSVKQVIFGLIYQQGVRGVAASTGQTVEMITGLIKAFFKRFPVGAGWFEKIKSFARKKLFVESPVGRRRHLWPLLLPTTLPNAETIHAATERRAVNSPVQGLGSDFLDTGARVIEQEKWAHYEKTGHYPDFHTTNSVHDSLEFSVAYADIWNAIRIIEYGLTDGVMKAAVERHGLKFTVPLEIDFEIGGNLRDCDAWDYSLDDSNGKGSFNHLIRETLKFQRDELGHKIDVDEVFKQITETQYKDMPHWAKKQLWNTGKQPKGVKDPRKKSDILTRKDLNKIYKLE